MAFESAMLSVKASLAQLSVALFSPPSGSPFSGFLHAAGVAGEAGLGVTGAERVSLRSPLPPQAGVTAPVFSAVASTSVVSATFDGILYQQEMCSQVLP